MGRRVVLIRAINLGSVKLPMAELREIATDLGATEVSTYIASGNLLCVPPGDPGKFDRALETAIEERYGFFREVISRTPTDLEAALDAHPFEIDNPKSSAVYFLTGEPDSAKATAFEARDHGPDELRVIGADLHIHYAAGVGKSKLGSQTIARGLGVTGTGRNLLTVRKLLELAS